MFERFAEEARRATALASQEARQLGHDFIGTEHMLLGLLAAGAGAAYTVLDSLEVTIDDARRMVSERVHPSEGGDVESPPFTPLAKKSLSWALREAIEAKSPVIGSEHLLLGLIDVPDGGGARILEELGGSLLHIREAVVRVAPVDLAGAESGAAGGISEEPAEQTKAPVSGRTLRRWAAQGRTVLRSPAGSPEASAPRAGPLGAAPRCPACRSSVASEARYRRVAVGAGPGDAEEEPRAATGTAGAAGAASGATAVEEPSGVAVEGEAGTERQPASVDVEPVMVTVVYCGHCGITLGIA